ncbi:hypothetical protein HPP92_016538 [Vanilla planifolia]|uniref:Uncharacterized protein n=1 Tax=Vanilla planifolia TaxID=51239 RepID=A0A835UST8_VANPL|nr:hypothetical protein HPP92_017126 [Vanilla planifolia]KAG0471992.1 hypothetical protein HPP92_016538 [Vanilla planifolia]
MSRCFAQTRPDTVSNHGRQSIGATTVFAAVRAPHDRREDPNKVLPRVRSAAAATFPNAMFPPEFILTATPDDWRR